MAHVYGKPVGEVVKEGHTSLLPLFRNVAKDTLHSLIRFFFLHPYMQDLALRSLHIQKL